MMRWTVTEADRGPDGRILVNPFEQEIRRAMTDIGGQAPPAEPEGGNTPAGRRRFGRLEIAGIVGGLLLGVAAIAVIRGATSTPASLAPLQQHLWRRQCRLWCLALQSPSKRPTTRLAGRGWVEYP